MDASTHFLDPDDLPEPTDHAVGGWTCPCGTLSIGPFRGTPGVIALPQCPNCLAICELLALPLDSGGESGGLSPEPRKGPDHG